jgi:hypothetical protein
VTRPASGACVPRLTPGGGQDGSPTFITPDYPDAGGGLPPGLLRKTTAGLPARAGYHALVHESRDRTGISAADAVDGFRDQPSLVVPTLKTAACISWWHRLSSRWLHGPKASALPQHPRRSKERSGRREPPRRPDFRGLAGRGDPGGSPPRPRKYGPRFHFRPFALSKPRFLSYISW